MTIADDLVRLGVNDSVANVIAVGNGGPLSTTSTWANRPSATTSGAGATLFVTNIPSGVGSWWVSDGANWRPQAPIRLAFSNVAIGFNITASSQTLATVTIPGGSVGPNGGLTVELECSISTWTSGYLGILVQLGGVTKNNYTPVPPSVPYQFAHAVRMRNRNAVNSQLWNPTYGPGPYISLTSAPTTGATDMSVDTTLTLIATNQTANVIGNLEMYEVWIY